MVPIKGFEPPTFALRKHCSTPELNRLTRKECAALHSENGTVTQGHFMNA